MFILQDCFLSIIKGILLMFKTTGSAWQYAHCPLPLTLKLKYECFFIWRWQLQGSIGEVRAAVYAFASFRAPKSLIRGICPLPQASVLIRQKACKKEGGRDGGIVLFAAAECYPPLLSLAENFLDIKFTVPQPIPILPLLLIPVTESLDSGQGHG